MQIYGTVSRCSCGSPIPDLTKKFEQKGVAYMPVFTVCNCYNNIQINNSGVFRDNEVVITWQ